MARFSRQRLLAIFQVGTFPWTIAVELWATKSRSWSFCLLRSPNNENSVSIKKGRIYEHWIDWTWRNWCSDCQKVKRCGLSGENGKFERARLTQEACRGKGSKTCFSRRGRSRCRCPLHSRPSKGDSRAA